MRSALFVLFGAILTLMIGVTVWASFERNVFDAGYLFAERWFVATFFDAYCGFAIFCVWVIARERRWTDRVGWTLAVLALGNIATSLYLLVQLARRRSLLENEDVHS
jgi:hypothetical protein